MCSAQERSGEELGVTEIPVHVRGGPAVKYAIDHDHQNEPERQTYHGCDHDESDRARPFTDNDSVHASLGEGGAGIAANKSMGRADWQSEVPGEYIPDNRARQTGHKHIGRNDIGIDKSFPDRGSNTSSEEHGSNEVDVSDILTPVRSIFKQLINLFLLQKRDSIYIRSEQVRDLGSLDRIRLVLNA